MVLSQLENKLKRKLQHEIKYWQTDIAFLACICDDFQVSERISIRIATLVTIYPSPINEIVYHQQTAGSGRLFVKNTWPAKSSSRFRMAYKFSTSWSSESRPCDDCLQVYYSPVVPKHNHIDKYELQTVDSFILPIIDDKNQT